LHIAEETVAATRNSLDEAGIRCGVPEDFADFVDGRIQAVIKIDECVGWPQAAAQVFAGDYGSRTFKKCGEDRKRLVLKADAPSVLAEFACIEVGFENAEASNAR
jgi:hypothetical protein